MIYDGPSHRGCRLSDERKAIKRRFYRPGLRVSAKVLYDGLKQALDAEKQAELDQEILFVADCSNIRYLKLQHALLFTRG